MSKPRYIFEFVEIDYLFLKRDEYKQERKNNVAFLIKTKNLYF